LTLNNIFPVAVVIELVDDAASAQGASGVALSGIDANIDDHGRAVADNDGLGRRRIGEAPPTAPTPAADEQLIPVKAVETEAVEAIGAEAVKPVRTEAVEAKSASLKPPVEAARGKMGKIPPPKARRLTDPPMRAYEGERLREKTSVARA
jgi:hypothetical protein